MNKEQDDQRGGNSLQRELEEADDDWDKLCSLLFKAQINPGETFPRTPQDVKRVIQRHIDNKTRSFHAVHGLMKKRSKLMIEVLRKYRQHQLRCQKFYDDARKEIGQLNQLMTCQLNIYRPQFKEDFKERSKRLQEGRVKILILGEICAGKSSILNILMGGQYFPVGHGHCTRIPCEVQNDTIRHAYFYYEEEQWAEPSFSCELSINPDDPSWIRLRRAVVRGYDLEPASQDHHTRPLHKIIISWPLEVFQNQQTTYKIQTEVKMKATGSQTSPKATVSTPTLVYERNEDPKNLLKSSETEVLKAPKENTALKTKTSDPMLEYKGLMIPAIETGLKGQLEPANTVEDSAESFSVSNTPKPSSDPDSMNLTSDFHDESLKLINGITFVDAPGIRDTDESFISLKPLIQSCDAFIFVISIAEHDNVDRDRVVRLMEMVQKTSESKNNFFNPQCALFLCNKWDLVDDDEYRDTVQDTVLQKLRQYWPGISTKQLFPVCGSKQIQRQIQSGTIPSQYEKFYHGVCSFIETATSISIEYNCWWLTSFLDRIVVLQKNAQTIQEYAQQQKREVEACLNSVKTSMLEIDDARNEFVENMKVEHEKATKSIQDRVKILLKSNSCYLCAWHDSGIPVQANNLQWRQYQHDLNKEIAKKIEQLLLNDEETDHIVDKYEKVIKNYLLSMKKLITEEDSKASYLQPLTASIDLSAENIDLMTKAKFPLLVLAVVVTLPVAPLLLIFWHVIEELTVPILQDDEQRFLKNPEEYMAKQTKIFIEKILKERLSDIAKARLEGLSSNANHMMQFFYTCIENRLKSVDEMIRQIESETVTNDNHEAVSKITTELAQFYVQEVMKHEISFDSLRTDIENPAYIIGEGGPCSYVVKGEYFDEQSNEVAVKVIKWPRGEEECIFRECFLLRQLSQKPEEEKNNFVKFFGSTFDTHGCTFKLLLVCELCHTDLSKIINMETLMLPSEGDVPFPGDDPQRGRSWCYFFYLAKQAASGLNFVHSNGIVHRHVKPSNFLIKFSGDRTIVKISDVGLSRDVDLISTAKIGTKIYSAPEVQLGSLHSFSSDVYSMCLVLFELWYGHVIPFKIPAKRKLNFYIPPPQLHDTQPPQSLKELLRSAWGYLPSQRPRSFNIVQCLSELASKYRYH